MGQTPGCHRLRPAVKGLSPASHDAGHLGLRHRRNCCNRFNRQLRHNLKPQSFRDRPRVAIVFDRESRVCPRRTVMPDTSGCVTVETAATISIVNFTTT